MEIPRLPKATILRVEVRSTAHGQTLTDDAAMGEQ